MREFFSNLENFVESERENILRDWIEFVKIPSVGTPKDGNLPYGKEVDRMLHKTAGLFSEYGFPMTEKTDLGYALHVSGQKGKTVGLFLHADVVDANEEEWTFTKPFEPIVKSGYLIGRGARDNKCGIVATLYALKALKSMGVELKNNLTVFVGGNEETGMKDIQSFVQNEKMPDISLVPDNSFPFSRGERGLIHLMLKSKKPFDDIIEFSGGELYKVVLESLKVVVRANESLEAVLRNKGIEISHENGTLAFEIKGITGFTAYPEGTVSAAYLASKILIESSALSENDRQMLTFLNSVLATANGEALGIDMTAEDGKLTAANGIVKLCDSRLCFSLDIRYPASADGNEILEKIKENAEINGFEVEISRFTQGFVLEENEPIKDIFYRALGHFGGNIEEQPYISHGLTYARYLKNAYSFGNNLVKIPKFDGLEEGCGRAHQVHEAASVDGLMQGIKILATVICEIDNYLATD